jgi:hypothetical protein
MIITGFWEKRQFFRRKLSKIAENCDHNIDPWFQDQGRHGQSGEAAGGRRVEPSHGRDAAAFASFHQTFAQHFCKRFLERNKSYDR